MHAVPLGTVVDYDALTWPAGEGGGAAAAQRACLHSGSADYAAYLQAVCDAAAERARRAEGAPLHPLPHPLPAAAAAPPSPFRGVDSDSECDAGKEPGMQLFHGVEAGAGGEEEGSDGGEESGGEALRALRRKAAAAARVLGCRLAEPLQAYLYVLVRRQ